MNVISVVKYIVILLYLVLYLLDPLEGEKTISIYYIIVVLVLMIIISIKQEYKNVISSIIFLIIVFLIIQYFMPI